MKKIIITLLLLLPVFASLAQTRVAERSGRKPGWVNGLEKDYLIVTGTGSSLQDAQNKALNQVRENIVNAVAQNVRATSEMVYEETNFNNNVSVFLDKIATTVTSTSGPVTYLQGVTLSRVEDYYWEKLQDRRSPKVAYNYHIKYPFPEMELQKLVLDFKMRDRQMTNQLEEILDGIDAISAIEDIGESIQELRVLADYFIDARRDQAQMGISRLRELYKRIELVELGGNLGELSYALRFQGKFVTTAQRPQITSECARIMGTSSDGTTIIVKYDHYNCYEDPENHIFVRYRFANHNVENRFYFDVTENKASIFVSEPLRFTSIEKQDDLVVSYVLDITVVSRYEAPFTIDRIVVEWPGQPPAIIDNINRSFAGKGNHQLQLHVSSPVVLDKTSSLKQSVSLLSGHIHFQSVNTGEARSYRMLNHSYSTNW